jgi:integrase
VMEVKAARPSGKHQMLADGKGLYLSISSTGAKSWVFRYRSNDRRHDLGLGPYPDISLAEARARAVAQRRLRLDGHDPLMMRRAGQDQARLDAARRVTFKDCAESYIAAHRAGWRNPEHARQWPASLASYAFPVFGDLPVQMVDTALVTKALEAIWSTRPETASRVRNRIELVLDWAAARGYRTGENPARWRGHLDKLLASPARAKQAARRTSGRDAHHAALDYREIGAFMAELRQRDGITARALEFTILTAARTGEVIGARWSEFNIVERIWIVPGERMKSGTEHRVALSDAALTIINSLPRDGDLVFPGGKPGKPLRTTAMLNALRRTGHADLTVHGFRSTFTDWAAEQTAFPTEVVELALAHKVGSKVEQAYRRTDQFQRRRQLAEAWARFCSMPGRTAANRQGGDVVLLRA